MATSEAHSYGQLRPLFDELTNTTLSVGKRAVIRNKLILAHLPIAEHIARKFRNRGQLPEDLRQVAAVGLIHAIDRFDPKRGSDFLSFAVPTITGEVRRYFRDATWSVRVPRRLKELSAQLNATTAELSQQLGREPSVGELAAKLDLSREEICHGLAAGNAYCNDSLDAQGTTEGGTSPSLGDRIGIDDPELTLVENREALYPALAVLPERERAIVALRFFGNLTQTQIAQQAQISQMHVSRLLTSSMRMLRAAMTTIPQQRKQSAHS